MCRIDEQDFPIDPRQLTLEEWQNFKRRVTERAQQDRQQVLRAAAIALPRALLAAASECHNRTRSNLVLLSIVVEAFRMSDGGGKEAATIGYLCPIEFERKPGLA